MRRHTTLFAVAVAVLVLAAGGLAGVAAADGDATSGVTVNGTVASGAQDGTITTEASVVLKQDGSVVDSTFVESDGTFAFHGLDDNSYTLVVDAPNHRESTASVSLSGDNDAGTVTLDGAILNTDTSDSWTAIQPAVTAASAGQTVTVAPGTYTESVTIETNDLTLRSTGGAAQTTITASNGPAIQIDGSNGGSTGVVIDGFTLQGDASKVVNTFNVDDITLRNSIVDSSAADGSGGGMFTDGTATVDNVEFRDTDNFGVGLLVDGAAAGTTVTDSEFSGYDRGLRIENSSDALVSGVVATSNDVNGILLRNASGATLRAVDISNTFIDDDDVSRKGRAFQIFNSENVLITKAQVGPSNTDAGGIQADDGGTYDLSTITIEQSNFVTNGFGLFTSTIDDGGTLNNNVDATGNYFSGNDNTGQIDASSEAGSAFAAGRDAQTNLNGTISSGAADFSISSAGQAQAYLFQSGTLLDSAPVAADGSYAFRNVSDGTYTVAANASGHRVVNTTVTIDGSGTTADLTLPGAVENTRTGRTFTSIQSAIDAESYDVVSDDTIEVAPGTYAESVDFDSVDSASNLTIVSTGAATETTVAGQSATPTFNINVDGLTIVGLTVTAGSAAVGPVNSFDTNAITVQESIVRATGGQIGINTGATLSAVDNEILGDSAEASGIKLRDTGGTGSRIVENEVTGFGNATNAINATNLTIETNEFVDNGDEAGEDAVNVDITGGTPDLSTITVAQNNIVDNNFGLSVESPGTATGEIDADNNWWGSADGPNASGANGVADAVGVEPWLDAPTPDGQPVSTQPDDPIETQLSATVNTPTPADANATATYGVNVTVDQAGGETGEFVSLDFGTDTGNLSTVNASDVTIAGSEGAVDVEDVLTVNNSQTLVLDLANGSVIDDLSAGDTYNVTVENVTNGFSGEYSLTVGFHESGSAIGDVAADAFVTASDTYVVSQAPSDFQVTAIQTDSPVPEGDTLTVTATIENAGDTTATETVTLDAFWSSAVDSEDVTLDGGNATDVSLSLATANGDAASGPVTVSTPDDSRGQTVEVINESLVGTVSSDAEDSTIGAGDVTLELSQSGSPVATTTSDAGGSYVLPEVGNGTYTLTATATKHQTVSQSVTVDSGNATADLTLAGNVSNTGAGTTYVSVDNAVDNASTNDTITVSPGTYAETVTIATDNLRLESTARSGKTTITSGGPAITIDGSNGGSTGVVIDGFTLQGDASKVVNTFNVDDITLRNSIVDSSAAGGSGGGMFTDGTATVDNVEFRDTDDFGSGLHVSGAEPGTTVKDSEFSGYEIGLFLEQSNSSTVSNVTVTDNQNGIRLENTSTATIKRSAITNNNFTGVNVPASVNVSEITITENNITTSSNGINLFDSGAGFNGTIQAENNWWGSADGPNASGANGVVGPVDFEPWLDAPTPDGQPVSTQPDDPIETQLSATVNTPTPADANATATYGVNVTVDQASGETGEFVSLDFGTDTGNLSIVNASDVTITGSEGAVDVEDVLTVNNSQTLVLDLANGSVIDDLSAGDTYNITVENVTNGFSGEYSLTVGFHESGSAIGGVAADAYATAADSYNLAAKPLITATGGTVEQGENVTVDVSIENGKTIQIEGIPNNWSVVDRQDDGAITTGNSTLAGWVFSDDGAYNVSVTLSVPADAPTDDVTLTAITESSESATNETTSTVTVERSPDTTVDMATDPVTATADGSDITVTVTAAEELVPDEIAVANVDEQSAGSFSEVGATGESLYEYEATISGVADGNYSVDVTNVEDAAAGNTLDPSETSTANVTVDTTVETTTGSFSGTIQDDSLTAIADTQVTFTDSDDDQLGQTTTDENGEYTVEGVEAGEYTITASADGYEDDTTDTVTITATEDTESTEFNLTLAESPQFDTAFIADENPNQIVVGFNQAVVLDGEVSASDASAHFTFNLTEGLTNDDVSVSTDALSVSNDEIIVPLDSEITADDPDTLTNALTYSATNGVIVDDNDGTTTAEGFTGVNVSNNVAGQVASVENLETDHNFTGIVADENALTVTADVSDVDDNPANGDVSINIVRNGEILYDAGTATVSGGDLSTTISTENINDSVDTGTAEIEVAGTATTSVNLVHEAIALQSGFNLQSIPQPATLYEQNVESVSKWDPATGYDAGIDGDSSTSNLHNGLYLDAASDDARLGFDYQTEEVTPATIELDDGWHLVGSNFAIDTRNTEELNDDLTSIEVSDPGITVYSSDQRTVFDGSSSVAPNEAYWILVDDPERRDRGIIKPPYDPEDRGTLLSGN